MLRLVMGRLNTTLVTLVLVSVMVFGLLEILPGDACTAYLGRGAKGSILETCREEFGLNRPALERFGEWAGGLLQGDLGISMHRNKPIDELVGWRLRNTVLLAFVAAVVGIPIAIFLGVLSGLKRNRPTDVGLSSLALLAMSVPEFVTATALILVFNIGLGWTTGIVTLGAQAPLWDLLAPTVLPTATLCFLLMAHIQRMVRSSVIDTLESDFVAMARLKGVPYWRLVWRHVLPNSLLPTVNVIGLTLAWLLSGVVVIETVFNYPGLGRLVVAAVTNRDLPMLQCLSLLLAAIYIGVNTLADLAALLLNPRLRTLRT